VSAQARKFVLGIPTAETMFGGDRPYFRQGAIPVPDQNTGPSQIPASASFGVTSR
jgi:hypothetical protein